MLLGVVIFLVWRSPVTEYVTKRTISNAVLINDSMAKKVLYAKFADIFTKVTSFPRIISARCANTEQLISNQLDKPTAISYMIALSA